MQNEIFLHLQNAGTVLTPSRRLAVRLKEVFNQSQALTQKVWATPSVFAYEDWLNLLWEQYEIDGYVQTYLLNSTESLVRWEYIIQQSSIGQTLLRPLTLAKQALQAWALLHQWRALHLLAEPTQQIDHVAFQQWANSYQNWLEENHYCDNNQLPEQLLNLLSATTKRSWQRVSACQKMMLYGFEELTPLQTHFFKTLKDLGWQIAATNPVVKKPETLKSLSFEQTQDEWKGAAIWAKNLLQSGGKNIAIIVPNLVDCRQKIEIIFNDILSTLQVCQPNAQINRLINLSAAIPLSHYPLARAALNILRLAENWSFSDYVQLVQTPFVGGSQTELLLRAQYINKMLTNSQAQQSLKQTFTFLGNLPETEKPQQWQNLLSAYHSYLLSIPQMQSWTQWSEHFQVLLSLMQWPGERILNSIEFQAHIRWRELIQSLASLDNVLPSPNFKQAYAKLLMLVMHTPFQPENKQASIQILGLLEGAGQEFEHLWVMGLHNEAWPPQADPNPFIALHIQRQLNMPHASAQRQTEYAQKMIQRLKHSAKEVIFSYSRHDGGRPLEISELIRELPCDQGQVMDVIVAEKLFAAPFLEKIIDHQAPPIESETFVANSQTLALQAICPFKAFAQERLAANEIILAQPWLLAFQRGIILHHILENFWSQLKDQKSLQRLTAQEYEEKIDHLIEQQLKKYCSINTPMYYRQIEKERLKMILRQYMQLEQERPAFKVIALEQEQLFHFAGMQFKLRCDRIDQDENDRIILIDYKTGEFKLSDLWGERPRAPQLGLYYLAWDHYQPQAMGAIKLNLVNCEWVGLNQVVMGITGLESLNELRDKDAPSAWEDLKTYWQNQLYPLANAFKVGIALVDPLQGKQTCQFCHLQPICRMGEK